MHVDCDIVLKRRLRSKDEYLGNNLMMSIGPYFSQYGSPFEGEVEQLAISSDSQAAAEQYCFPLCQNGGTCLPGNICRCSQEFFGDRCQNAVCKQLCQNGGHCVYPGHCVCPQGYYGPTCEPLCKRGCYNGGRCVGPNICACPAGYHGKRCQKAECQPACQHGGVCVSPDLCLCKNGYSGSRCQK
ncbi:unnamed protein product, partial [Candidula unifasciata]